MGTAASSLSKYSIATLIALAHALPVGAQDDAGLAAALDQLHTATNAQDMTGMVRFVPPRVLHAMADGRGMTLDRLHAEFAQYRIEDMPEPLRVHVSYAPFDPARAEWHRRGDGLAYALLPVRITATSGDGTCGSDSIGIVFQDDGWRFMEIGDPYNRAGFLDAYPQFAGLPAPRSTENCDFAQTSVSPQEDR